MAIRNDVNAQIKSDMVNYNGASDGQVYFLLGETVQGDSPMRAYYYSSSSTATIDGENVLSATGMGVGRFLKVFTQPAISLTNTGSSGASTWDVTTCTLNIPNYSTTAPTFNNSVSRTLNSNYTISSTQRSDVTYSVTCSVTNPLIAGSSTASAFLEYSTNGGSSWVSVSDTGNSSSVGVAVAIAITNTQTTILTGKIPANALVRIRTATTGTASVTYVRGQEILL